MRKFFYLAMVSFAAIFAGCSNDEDALQTADSLKDKPINVDVLVSDIKTRAGYDNTSLPTKFYLTIDQDGTEHDYTNVVMKNEDGKWVAYESDAADANKVEMHWAGSEGNITVKAATFSLAAASVSLSAQTSQSTAEAIKSSDHLYYYSDAVTPSSDGTISIPLDHVMSKLEVKVTLRSQYGGSGSNPITSAIFFGSATSATYSTETTTPWSELSDASNITPCLSAPYNSAERIANYEAILIPQNIASNTFGVKVTIGDKSYTWKSANPITLQGGKKYTLDLTLGKNELTLNKLSVGIWNEEKVTGLNAEQIPYVTFTASSTQKFTMNFKPDTDYDTFIMGEDEYFEYSVGNGEWKQFTETVSDIKFGGNYGNLRLRGKSSMGTTGYNEYGCTSYSTISFGRTTPKVSCTGDIRTLIDYENYADVSTKDARFMNLFKENERLKTAPALPATTLAKQCYQSMFEGCSSLTEAPALPATTLADFCYEEMFDGCSSLTKAPALPATTLARECYYRMFADCSNLTEAPALPATTLAHHCYGGMFLNCSSLTKAPALPATTLVTSCYYKMFEGCSALSSVTMLATDGLNSDDCLNDWLGYLTIENLIADKNATTRTLTLANQEVYNTLEWTLPDIWKSGKATINYNSTISTSSE